MADKLSNAEINKIRLKEQVSDPGDPPVTGYTYLFAKDDGLYLMQDDGTVLGPFGEGGGGGGGGGTPTLADVLGEGNDADGLAITGLADPTNPQDAATRAFVLGTKLDDFAAPDDNTDLDASTSRHGLLPKLPDDETMYLDGSGTWSTPAGGGSGGVDPAFTPLDNSDFAWVNQGSADVWEADDTAFLKDPGGSGTNLRIRKKSAPGFPYRITVALRPNLFPKQYSQCGILFRESGSGKIASFNLTLIDAAGIYLGGTKFTDASNYSADYLGGVYSMIGAFVWLRISDDNTDRICSVSMDGRNFIEIHRVGRTDFLTADEVGFFVQANNGSAGPVAMTIYSWVEEAVIS